MNQNTIRKSVECSGVGLHGGRKVRMVCRPADENTGIVFRVVNGNGSRIFSPRPDDVVSTGLATTLGRDGVTVATVEHLLAAVRGLGIDNIVIDVEGGEVPIMDGSAASFVMLLRSAGLRRQAASRRVLAVTRPLVYEEEGKKVEVRPGDGFSVDCVIDFAHPLIGRQTMSFKLDPDSFSTSLAKARTFGFLKEVEWLHSNGLALGGSLENAVVLDEYGVLNPEGLRFDDEFVRHKVLDFIGDMALSPLPLEGHFTVHCSGHALNNAFLRVLIDEAGGYVEEKILEPVAALGQTRNEDVPEAVPGMAALA